MNTFAATPNTPSFPMMSPHFLRLGRCGLALVVAQLVVGCATYKNVAPFPAQSGVTTITVPEKSEFGMNDRPVGGYYDEKSRIMVTGHQKGMLTGMLFGVVGVLATDAINKSSAKSKYGDNAATVQFDQVAEARAEIDRQLATGQYAAFAVAGSNDRRIEIHPRAQFAIAKDGSTRLYALWNVRLLDKADQVLWQGRYFASAHEVMPLNNTDGWFSGTHYADGLHEAMSRAAWALLGDVGGVFKEGRTVKVKGRMAWLNEPLFELPGIVLTETDDHIVVRLLAGDALLCSGTHVFRKGEVTIVDAKVKDPRK